MSRTKDDVIYTGRIGNPGQTESATFSPLEREGDMTDVGKIIQEELEELNPTQAGYREDMVKYKDQIEKYKGLKDD
jgi:hypothetical protein